MNSFLADESQKAYSMLHTLMATEKNKKRIVYTPYNTKEGPRMNKILWNSTFLRKNLKQLYFLVNLSENNYPK